MASGNNSSLRIVSELIHEIITKAYSNIKSKQNKRSSLENHCNSSKSAMHIELLPKHETYMQRKLRKINEEVMSSFAGIDFVKSYSRLEKEKMLLSVNDKRKNDYQFESPDPAKKVKKNEEIDNSAFSTTNSSGGISESMIMATPTVIKKSPEKDSENPSAIQSEDKTAEPIEPVQPFQNVLETNLENKDSMKRIQLKELKKNLNTEFTESLDSLLSKSKKKLPKIAEEKRLLREKEEQEKILQLKQMKTKEMIFKWDNVVFNDKN